MKKYLFNGAMALIVGAFIVSCSHDDIGQTSTVDEMTKSFDEMFKELYGPIAPNHNWGFSTVLAEAGVDEAAEREAAGTRTAYTNSNMWESDGLTVPAAITDREYEVVMNYFRTTPNPESETVDIHNYFIQNVGYTDHTYPGEGVELKSSNGNNITITNPGRTQMDYIFVGPGAEATAWNDPTPKPFTWNEGDDHVNNFNANSGEIQYIKYSGSEWFGFHDSYGTGYSTPGHGNNGKYCEKNRNFVIRYIDVDGVVGCYVGFNYESGKTSEGWHLEPDDFFDDRVIKLVAADLTPSTPEPEPEDPTPTRDNPYRETESTTTTTYREIVDLGRVFCEDIATSTMGVTDDVDYNDIVFDARVWKYYDITDRTEYGSTSPYTYGPYNIRYQYDISMLAAGGTILVNVGENNKEVHDAFGVGHTFMVNTWMPNSKAFGQYNTKTMEAEDITSYTKYDVSPGTDVGISTIPINVLYKGQGQPATIALVNPGETESGVDENGKKIYTSSAPYKICVPIGKLWPIERVNIRDAYTDFNNYVGNPNYAFYDYGTNNDNLYTQAPTSSIQNDMTNGRGKGYRETVNTYTSSSSITVVWAEESISGDTSITLYNYSFSAGNTLRFFGSGTIRVLDTYSQEVIGSIPMSGGYWDVTIDSSQANSLNGGTIIINGINGSNFSLTKIAVL